MSDHMCMDNCYKYMIQDYKLLKQQMLRINIMAILPSIQASLLIFTFLILMIFMFLKKILSKYRTKKNIPPSPRKLPIIGNLHQLGLLPHRSLLAMAKRHGPLMLLHFGSVPILVASSAEVAGEILKNHDTIFCSRPWLKIPDKIMYGSKDIAFSPYGEYWRQVKSIAVLQLLSSKRVQSFRRVREEEIDIFIKKIGASYGSSVNLRELLVSLTNNVVCRVALGRTIHGLNCKTLMERMMDLLGVFSIGSYIPWLSWVDWLTGLHRKTNEFCNEIDEFLEGVIEEHTNARKETNGGSGNDDRQDLVDILLELQREKLNRSIIHRDTIKAVVLDIFAAGTDTTSTNIEWAISELVTHPRVLKKLQQEVTEIANGRSVITEEDLENMNYLKSVIKETLRIHIPLPLLVQREASKDVKLMGYDIAAGTRVVINAWALGRDPLLWEEPEEFRPERFLNSSIDYIGSNFEFIPFGAGRRACPGIQFSLAVSQLALANLVYKYDLALPHDKLGQELDMSESAGIVAHRKFPLLLVATPRIL